MSSISAHRKSLVIQGYNLQKFSSHAHEASNPSRTPEELHPVRRHNPKEADSLFISKP
jgi:hypothetical protein